MASPAPTHIDWPHAPPHRLGEIGVYFVTARALGGRLLLKAPEMRDWFQDELRRLAEAYGWRLEAWAVLPNHYHLIAHTDVTAESAVRLSAFLRHLHSSTTRELNRRRDPHGGHRLWHNYRETRLTLPNAHAARLHYVHGNAVHHGLVLQAHEWPWCSAAEFERSVSPARRKTIYSFKYEQIAADDGE